MIFIIIFAFILIYCILTILIPSVILRIILFFIFIAIMQFILILYRDNRKQHVKRVSTISVYHNLHHGDIVMVSPNSNNQLLDQMILTLNQGTSHIMLIIEENGIKYALHAYPSLNKEQYTINETPFFGPLGGPKMVLVKEPLDNLLSLSTSSTYQVFRSNKNIIIPNDYQLDRKAYFHYCTRAIGPILAQSNVIKKDNRLFFPYRPDYIVSQLVKEKIPCFYMYHDPFL